MIPPSFDYHAPDTVDEALALLNELGAEAKVLAGGHSLLPMMKLRFAEPSHLVDLNNITVLRGIREHDGAIHIGAMTTESDLLGSVLLQEKCPLLPEAAAVIADPQVRNRGTLGGDIAHGDPGNDHPAIMLALNASFVLQGTTGERVVAADDFFLGTYYNLLEANEILTEIRIPASSMGPGQAYCKLKRKTGDWATAAAAVVLQCSGSTCSTVRIALTNVAPCAIRVKEAEDLLQGKEIDEGLCEAAAQQVMAKCEPEADLRGSVEYKTHMAGEMTRRAIRLALQRWEVSNDG